MQLAMILSTTWLSSGESSATREKKNRIPGEGEGATCRPHVSPNRDRAGGQECEAVPLADIGWFPEGSRDTFLSLLKSVNAAEDAGY